jgi:hypothetical protein
MRNVVTTPTAITATFQITFSEAAGPATVTNDFQHKGWFDPN